MNYIHDLTNYFLFIVLGLKSNTHLADALEFFITDSIKILLLLIIITHLMSLMRYYLPIEKIRDFLVKHNFYGLDYFLATIFGAVTPFCSCSSIPLFIGFMRAGIPLGVTFAFLITSPLINEVAISLFLVSFGKQITLVYVSCGILIGMLGGFILSKLKMKKYVEKFVYESSSQKTCSCKNKNIKHELSRREIIKKISKEAFDITKQVLPYVLIGVGIGALIHGYVPALFFEKYLGNAGFFAVPLAVILAIPFYSNASGVIPIIESLVNKGVPIGTALAFMMAVVGLSFPEAMILKKVLKWQLLLTFFGIVTFGIILIGYFLNFLRF